MDNEIEPLNAFCTGVDVKRIMNLRHGVLRPGLPEETATFEGDTDESTYHFACYLQERGTEPACCVSYMKVNYNGHEAYQLRGMATHEDFRGKKLGSTLMAFAEQEITERTDITVFWCKARVEAIPFYEKQGWACVSEEFEIEGVGPHRVMLKQ